MILDLVSAVILIFDLGLRLRPAVSSQFCVVNPKDIPPDDLDDKILGRMIKAAGMLYKVELDRSKGWQ